MALIELEPLAALDPRLADEVDGCFDRWPVPGLALAAVSGGRHFGHFRGRTIAGGGTPVNAGTVFDICSGAKAFTALAIGLLTTQGTLAWDDPVVKHLPGWRLHDPWLTQHVSLRDLLAQRVGLATWLPGEEGMGEHVGAAGLISRMHGLPSLQPFRSGFCYANTNCVLAHAVLRQYAESLQEILQPVLAAAGMHDTHFDAPRFKSDAARARSHAGAGEQGALLQEAIWADGAGAGNAYINARDAARWLALHIDAARGDSGAAGAPWRQAIVEGHEPHTLVGPGARKMSRCAPSSVLHAYGLGWAVADLHGQRIVLHGGEMPGRRAWLGFAPGAGVGVVVMVNASRPLPWALGQLVLHRLLGVDGGDHLARAQAAHLAARADWAAGHQLAADAARASAVAQGPQPGRWQQSVAGPLEIKADGDGLRLTLADAPFWNGRLLGDGPVRRVQFDDPAARDIFEGLAPPQWVDRSTGRLEFADFGPFDPV